MWDNDNEPSVPALCTHCNVETVWLRTRNGGWLLFDTAEQPTCDAFDGNRYAVDRRTRLVVDLEDVKASRWPVKCLSLHRYRCPDSYDESRFYRRRPRQANDVDLSDLFRRLAAAEACKHERLDGLPA